MIDGDVKEFVDNLYYGTLDRLKLFLHNFQPQKPAGEPPALRQNRLNLLVNWFEVKNECEFLR